MTARVIQSKGSGTITGYVYRETEVDGKTVKTPLLTTRLTWNNKQLRATVNYGEYYLPTASRILSAVPVDLGTLTQSQTPDGHTFSAAVAPIYLTFGDTNYAPISVATSGKAYFTSDGALWKGSFKAEVTKMKTRLIAVLAVFVCASSLSLGDDMSKVKFLQSYITGTNRKAGVYVREGFNFATTISGDFSEFTGETQISLVIGGLNVFQSLGTSGTTESFTTIGEALDMAGQGYVKAHVYQNKGYGTITGYVYRETTDSENEDRTIKTPLMTAKITWNSKFLRVIVNYGEYYWPSSAARILGDVPYDLSVITQADTPDGRTFSDDITITLTFGDQSFEPTTTTLSGKAFYTPYGAMCRAFTRLE